MRITVEMTLLVGSAAMALASPIASPGPPSPMSPPPPPKNADMGVMVASVGRCPVRTMMFLYLRPLTPLCSKVVGMRQLQGQAVILIQMTPACAVRSLTLSLTAHRRRAVRVTTWVSFLKIPQR
jgi:hypothetical protein